MKKTYLSCKFLLVILVTMIISTTSTSISLIGQNNIDNFKIDFVYYENQRYVKEINFLDTEKGSIVKSFNIPENNPYQNLQYPIFSQSKQGYNIFEINDLQINDIDLNGPNFVYARSLTDTFKINNGAIKSYHELRFTDTSHIILKYHLNLYMGDGLVGVSNTIYIFRKDGELLKKYDQFNTQCLFPCVTSDSKYFAYSFGGVVDESLIYFADLGYHIIDLEKDELIIDHKIDKRYHGLVTTNDSASVRVLCEDMDNCRFIIYDFSNSKKYEKEYPTNVIGLLRNVNKYGFVFVEDIKNPKKFRTDYFETDFLTEEIK